MRVPELVLTSRLKRLVEHQVLEKRPAPAGRRQEYWLTERGLELFGLLIAIWDWESTHVPAGQRHYPKLTHLACGKECRPVLTCGHCHQPAGARDTMMDGKANSMPFAAAIPGEVRFRRSIAAARGQGDELLRWQTLGVIGDLWSNAVLGSLFRGRHGFDELEQDLGIPPAVLSSRLSKFQQLGIIRRAADAADARRRFYRLTEKGMALYPVTIQLVAWGDRWLSERPGEFRVIHRACGHTFRPVLACSECGGELKRREIRLA